MESLIFCTLCVELSWQTIASENVYLTDVPDYEWYGGCFGTASGNLIGYWDRHGFPDMYTGPTAGGVAPLTSRAPYRSIIGMWSSAAGRDQRPVDQPGHENDYWIDYESAGEDPFVTAHRPEHSPDCIGDFIGLSQRKWVQLNGECDGNVDGYSFNFFDPTGSRVTNFVPRTAEGQPLVDIQSGLRNFATWRGYGADSFSQLAEFHFASTSGIGFNFGDLREEIDAGYPLLVFLQATNQFQRTLHGIPNLNPVIHAVLVYGYVVTDDDRRYARLRTSWASGDTQFNEWTEGNWLESASLSLPVRGVIGFRPKPRIFAVQQSGTNLLISWHGPLSVRRDEVAEITQAIHHYVLEVAESPEGEFLPLGEPIQSLEVTIPICCEMRRYFRVRLQTLAH